ncbi:helix-turn-helix domain-containing protein [Streptomyces sp. p1417]|uniref:Helix-turn-helix domain-containing protein n=1 Tax=Streptomyces typhae TaxID=2681492 RepID=A0A6L6WUH8_9ACTN|nr:helix-turn-helix transcriptional regulator [Streptomyces typhae]MVO83591.1 helix-turn-helix domain-containing protein [Streptomyces typhae]
MDDDIGWEVDADDESSAVAALIGRQIKFWREAAGLRAVQFGERMGYGENLIHKVERGARIPRPEFLDRADEVLGAGGQLRSFKPDAERARYPRRVRDLAKLEARSVEVCAYNNSVIEGLLQTPGYAAAVFGCRRPPFSQDELDTRLAARMARTAIIDASKSSPVFSFVQCESTLRRTLGGTMVRQAQLEHLLQLARLRNVNLQVLPLDLEENAGLSGPFKLFKLKDGSTVAHSEAQLTSRVISDPKEVQILDVRYGMIRAQALRPRESLAFIDKLRGEA